jgi:integrase
MLPLSPLALSLVGSGEANALVFPNRDGGRFIGFGAMKNRIDELSGVAGWRLHDLRRTAATQMQEIGTPPYVISATLNHSLGGVTAIYLRSHLEEAKRAALATWATALMRIVRRLHVVA